MMTALAPAWTWVVTFILILLNMFGLLNSACFDDDGPGPCLNVSRNVHGDPPETVLVGLAYFDDLAPSSCLNVGCDAHGDLLKGFVGLAYVDDLCPGSCLNVGCDMHSCPP